jgi:hypothetical protein
VLSTSGALIRPARALGLIALFLVAGRPSIASPGQANDLEKEVQAAGERGVAYLSKIRTIDYPYYRRHPLHEAQALALLVWDQPTDQVRLDQCLSRMNDLPWDHTYNVAFRACVYALLLEKNPDDADAFARLAMAAKFLVETQLASGQWGYGLGYLPGGQGYLKGQASARIVDEQVAAATAKLVPYGKEVRSSANALKGKATRLTKGTHRLVKTTVDGSIRGRIRDGDFSNSQIAAFGLAAAFGARLRIAPDVYLGLSLPPDTVERAIRGWTEAQNADGGWGYDGARKPSYFSMTAGGLFALTALHGLGGKLSAADPTTKRLAEVLRQVAPAAEKAVKWVDAAYSVEANSRVKDAWPDDSPSLFHFYALFSLERAATVAGLAKIGDRDWYAEGARWLIKAQADDGGWPEETVTKSEGQESPDAKRARRDIATCFALLFLKRATARIVPKEIATPGGARNP